MPPCYSSLAQSVVCRRFASMLHVTGTMAQPTPTTTLMGKLLFTGRNFNAFCNKISLLVRFYLFFSCSLTLSLVKIVDAASSAAPDISFCFFLTLPDIVPKRIIYGLS